MGSSTRIVALGLLASATSSDSSHDACAAAGPAPEGGIIFISTRGEEGSEVYSMRLDGSEQRRLTFNQGIEDQVDVSPDGRWVLYTKYDFTARTAPGNATPGVWPDIHVTDIHGRESRLLVPFEMGGTFLHDGTGRILLTTTNAKGGTDLRVVGIDGGEPRRIVETPHKNSYVVPSPDGKQVLFSSSRDLPDKAGDDSWLANFEKYSMAIDGSNVTRLTDNLVPDLSGDYSLDGSKIVFVSDERICTMNADGSDKRVVFDARVGWDFVSFTRDGSRIVFAGVLPQGGPDSEIWSVRVDGTDLRQLTDNEHYDGAPKAW